jgi:hypothetical protein
MWGPSSLLKNQNRINTVSLMTDRGCGTNMDMKYFVDLAHFKELRSLTWRGLSRVEDFESVGKCIAANGRQLISLTLDLLEWGTAQWTWVDGFSRRIGERIRCPDNFFASTLLHSRLERRRSLYRLLSICLYLRFRSKQSRRKWFAL